jgi:selenocysteine-specific elongation factor
MPREELKSKLTPGAGSRAADAVLRRMVAAGTLAATETTIRLAAWEPRLSLVQQRDVDALLRAFKAEPYSPPVKAEWEALGAELIRYLLESGRLVRVSPDVLFDAEAFGKLVEWTEEALANAGEVTVAGVRDHFGTTRKYALAFLEYLDERKITRRVGDVRVSY